MRHPVRIMNPKDTCNQRCPVFPNRTPGEQPSISHGCKVAGSTFLKFQRRLRMAHQNWIRRNMYGFWCLRQISAHGTWCNILPVFLFLCLFLLLTSLRVARSGWSSQTLTGWSVIHLRTQAATISLQESLYPLLPSMLSVYWQVPRQQPSRTHAPLWKKRNCACGTLGRREHFCRPKDREIVTRPVPRNLNALRRCEKRWLQFNHSSPSFQSCQQFV